MDYFSNFCIMGKAAGGVHERWDRVIVGYALSGYEMSL